MKALPATLAACLALAATAAHAAPDNAWTFRFGVHDVSPTSGNGSLAGGALKADLDDSVRPTASIEYLVTPSFGIDLLAAWPFEHTLKLNGAKAATLKQLPPTLGVNFTKVYDEKPTGPLAGTDLSIGDSWGVAAHAGFDMALSPQWLITADVRWIDIDSTVRVNGAGVGTVHVDPWAFGISAGYRF